MENETSIEIEKPNTEDQRKIHAEVNQLSVQAMNVTLSALVLFGGITSAILLKDYSGSIPNIVTIACMAIIIVLSALYYMSYSYFRSLRFLTAYLRITKSSIWENHYFLYTKADKWPNFFRYSESRSILFAILGSVTCSLPFLLHFLLKIELETPNFSYTLAPIWFLYICVVLHSGFKKDVHLGQPQSKSWCEFFNLDCE